MSDTREIPWKRLVVEGAAIVASILLAFAIDAWWQDRSDQLRVTEYIEQVRALADRMAASPAKRSFGC